MLPLTRILCPTDFSAPAERALEAGAELALHFQAELVLFHVVAALPSLPPSMAGSSASVEELRAGIGAEGVRALEALRAARVPAEVACRVEVREGDAAEEIVHAAEELGVSLIAIATHGRTGWRHFVSGSVAEKVVRTAPCPVLAFRRPQAGT
jgi:nucleotide-binding universal stress UspA family protein